LRTLEEIGNRFGYFLLHAYDLNKVFYGLGSGLRQNLDWQDFKTLPCLHPPLSEQSAIVSFLDRMDRRIRNYIHAKQKLIKLLEEKKQAIIHRAVTRGLDPSVPLKPSGVEWLGDVPEHWEIVLNQRIFKEIIRPHGGEPETQLSLSQKDGLIATSEMGERSLQTSTFENWKVTLPGDLVLNRFKAHLGVFFASTLRGIVSFHYGVFTSRRKLATKYFELLYHTNVYRTIYAGRSKGMTIGLQNLSNQDFYNVRSIVPPDHEQAEIISFVEKNTERLNDAAQAAHNEVNLLREYRSRLISDVVTGKLDVRRVDLSAIGDVEVPEEYSDLLQCEEVMEDQELQEEIPVESD
jgi:type I restriction enzyme S subunit